MAEQWRILVVEGEENLNWNIVNTLQKDGYIVRGVNSGAETIRLLWSEECDIVICNQQMPDADGFDLLQWMRTYCPNTRMVMLATTGSKVTRTQALEMGAASYLEKPLDFRVLREELRRLLNQTGFSASLDSFDLLDVIQIITMSRKSIALVVSIGVEEEGVLRFQNGELIWAEYGVLRGEEAFFALAAHKNGTVVHRPWNDQITPNVTQPLSRLIFQALQYRSKYAEYQQLSSEMDIIRPGKVSSLLAPLPPTTIPDVLNDLEDDDRPFQFVAEDAPLEHPTGNRAFEPFLGNSTSQESGSLEAFSGVMGMVKQTEPDNGMETERTREWWEPTGSFPKAPNGFTGRPANTSEPIQAGNGTNINITPSTVHKTTAAQPNSLPSWLTDQPTHLDLPVLRDNTGQMPATPPASSPLPAISAISSALPVLPVHGQSSGAEWPVESLQTQEGAPFNPTESGLRKTKPDEALFTGMQRAIKPGQQPSLRAAPAEWQTPRPTPASSTTGTFNAPHMGDQQIREPLQSLQALKRPTVPLPSEGQPGPVANIPRPASTPGIDPQASAVRPALSRSGAQEKTPSGTQYGSFGDKTEKISMRNPMALNAALQTLGYTVPGFIASAIVGKDGTLLAQEVAVDGQDISELCMHLSKVIQTVKLTLEQKSGEGHEYTLITSRTQYILLRIIAQKDVFQVLVTTRESSPTKSLDSMANVEAAIAAVLP